jgi:D-3-phosphoglycerate dehydrogenase / 2-oxoglutarate reductase
LILPEEYRTLQPFVSLVEHMGSIYTQHYTSRHRSSLSPTQNFRTTFDITYDGAIASLNTTKPLFAALVKGLLAPITSSEDVNVNIVNAELVAKERGILINELRSREAEGPSGHSSNIILRARKSRSASQSVPVTPSEERKPVLGTNSVDEEDQVIEGFVSANTPYVSRIGRFTTNFVPEGTLLICRHYDSCGRIGFVGSQLGKADVNIRNMSVSPVDKDAGAAGDKNEALMILTVDKPVSDEVVKGLIGDEGVLETSVVSLS